MGGPWRAILVSWSLVRCSKQAEFPLFPDTLYEVIYEPWHLPVQDGQIPEPDEESYRAAMDALNGIDPTNGCLFYYNPKTATSRWMFKRPTDYTETIGNHVFMK